MILHFFSSLASQSRVEKHVATTITTQKLTLNAGNGEDSKDWH